MGRGDARSRMMRAVSETRRGWPCLVLLLLLGGCTASLQEAALRDGRDMRSVLHAHLGNSAPPLVPRRREVGASPQHVREFRRLPNPTLLMWIHPHFVGDNEAPVPGYVTAFFLYVRDHFALPGEWAPP